jgi:hypothetical protein
MLAVTWGRRLLLVAATASSGGARVEFCVVKETNLSDAAAALSFGTDRVGFSVHAFLGYFSFLFPSVRDGMNLIERIQSPFVQILAILTLEDRLLIYDTRLGKEVETVDVAEMKPVFADLGGQMLQRGPGTAGRPTSGITYGGSFKGYKGRMFVLVRFVLLFFFFSLWAERIRMRFLLFFFFFVTCRARRASHY